MLVDKELQPFRTKKSPIRESHRMNDPIITER